MAKMLEHYFVRFVFVVLGGIFLESCGGSGLTELYQFPVLSERAPIKKISLDNPSKKIVLIWSHGTISRLSVQDCRPDKIPSILVSYEPRVNGKDLLLYHLCSFATGTSGEFGSVVQDRVREITLTADKFIKAGVPFRNIFLTGISFGAWSSLQAAAAC